MPLTECYYAPVVEREYDDAVALAESIEATQREEIGEMQELMATVAG